MQKTLPSRQRLHERGQTILLVAVSLVSLLAMAALAIDIVTLYVARSEIQRAADAGAKAIADSGVTTLQISPPDPDLAAAQTLARNMATAAVTALINPGSSFNLVAGVPPTLVTSTPIPVDFTRQGNPHVTVSLQRTNLPTFFSKIWARSSASVTATATAEAYNPANVQSFTPIAPRSVKPWLVANADPTSSSLIKPPFVNTGTGVVEVGIVGKQFNLTADCQVGLPTCSVLPDNPPKVPSSSTATNPQVDYVPAQVTPTNPKNVCPVCAGATDYEQSIECADANAYAVLSCGGGAANATWDNSNNPGGGTGLSASGAECLINAPTSSMGQGQDIFNDPGPWPAAPFQIQAGTNNPQSPKLVTTSSSIVTIPIIDNTNPLITSQGPVTIVGFMQAFINQVQSGGTPGTTAGDIQITVLNIAGCSATPNTANPVVGVSGTSPIPVRLIAPP
jgi:hypothetical protein